MLPILALLINVQLKSQDYIRFDRIDPVYFTMEKCPFDSSAQAFFIFNEQSCIAEYHKKTASYDSYGKMTDGPDYRNKIHIHRSIKILDNETTNWGNISIVVNTKTENIESIKGFTYNVEGNKTVKTKLERNQIIYEEIGPTRERVKISMPQVKKGSVVEYEINISSQNFYSLGPYPLQFTIPVEKDILVIKSMDYYNYNRIIKGYHTLNPSFSKDQVIVPIVVTQQNFSGRERSETNLTYGQTTEEYSMDRVPAFPVEAYLTTPDNYISSVRLELAFTKFPNSPQKSYNTTWEALSNLLLEDSKFGQQLKGTGFLSDLATELKGRSADQHALAQACFEAIRDKITCNNKVGIFCEDNIREVYKSGEGDVPGINLLLTALLRESGISAWPVILSTRGNGMIQPVYPSLEDFNYVICMADVNGSRLLMDASDKYLVMNLLDPICLNDKGRIIDKTETGWIELTNTTSSYKRTSTWDVEFGENGTAMAKVVETYEDIGGYRQRDRIRDQGGFSKYTESINNPENGFTVSASDLENLEQLDQPLRQKLELQLDKDYLQSDLYIFHPLFSETMSENPFKLNKREYPVEFDYPYIEKVVVRTKIPEGYIVESLPPGKTYVMPGGAAKYGFKITANEHEIVTEYDFQRNKMLFIPDEYEKLKEFYQVVVESQNESVVLQRSSE